MDSLLFGLLVSCRTMDSLLFGLLVSCRTMGQFTVWFVSVL